MAKTSYPTRARPFRADHVGSLLRPAALIKARKDAAVGKLSAAELRECENREIAHAVKRQEDLGLRVVTDGEMRRTSWHMDFFCKIDGVEEGGTQLRPFENDEGLVRNEITNPRVVSELRAPRAIFGDDFAYLKNVARVTSKLSIPAPSILHGLGDTTFYDDEERLFDDLVNVYQAQIRKLEDLGCTYLQIDDTMLAMLADPAYQAKMRRVTSNPEELHLRYIELINRSLAQRSPNLTVCVHTCRGNHRSAWVASGGYDHVAEAVFSDLQVDGMFLEYDDIRSGSFEPLRFVPKGKRIVLGLVTSKRPELEDKDNLRRRIDEAARYVDLDQLCLSPQCGFASTSHGNLLTDDQQYAKLNLVVETALAVWGDT